MIKVKKNLQLLFVRSVASATGLDVEDGAPVKLAWTGPDEPEAQAVDATAARAFPVWYGTDLPDSEFLGRVPVIMDNGFHFFTDQYSGTPAVGDPITAKSGKWVTQTSSEPIVGYCVMAPTSGEIGIWFLG